MKVLGREVKYVDVPLQAALEAMVGKRLPEWYADAYNEYNKPSVRVLYRRTIGASGIGTTDRSLYSC